jgi:hypothetical protein
MTIEHVVLMKRNEDFPREEVRPLFDRSRDLFKKIPGILSLSLGENFSEHSKGFTHGLFIRFEGRDALDLFMKNPYHLEVAQLIAPAFSDFLIVDYETEHV